MKKIFVMINFSLSIFATDIQMTEKACQNNNLDACLEIGVIARANNDLQTAFEAFTKTCTDSYVKGCYYLAGMYVGGKGVEKNRNQAFSLLSKGCGGNEPNCCAYLGFSYQNGIGTKQNLNEAEYYYRKACDLKSKDGCEKYTKLKSEQPVQQNSQNDNYQQQQLELQRQQLAQEKERLESEERRDSYNRAINSMNNLGNQLNQNAYNTNQYSNSLQNTIDANNQRRQDKKTNYQLQQINNNLNGIRYGY